MSSRILVRAAEPADCSGINLIYRQWHAMAVWEQSRPTQAPDFAAVSEGEKIVVAVDPNEMVKGLMSVWVPEQFVHHLYVHAEYRRCGIGRALLDSLTTWLPRPWSLKCSTHNVAALHFYEQNGWRKLARGESENGPYWLLDSAGPMACSGDFTDDCPSNKER